MHISGASAACRAHRRARARNLASGRKLIAIGEPDSFISCKNSVHTGTRIYLSENVLVAVHERRLIRDEWPQCGTG